jgi:hypothetical protein
MSGTADDFAQPEDVKNFRTYKVTYKTPAGETYESVEFGAKQLPSHVEIMAVLEAEMPDRPRGGWYEMETI